MSEQPNNDQQPALRPKRLHLPARAVVPNVLTVLALCAGLTAIRFALDERFEASIAAVMVAAVLDGLDGRLARMIKGTSRFGAELDSLTDFVNFGVVPALILYLWGLDELGGFGWIVVLGFAVCCALRLARFNVTLDDPDLPAWTAGYFTGVPAPAGALIVFLPIYINLWGLPFPDWMRPAIAPYVAVVAFLLVSQLPTFSFKRVRIRRDAVLPLLVGVALVAAMVANYPWIALSAIALGYYALIPVANIAYRKRAKAAAEGVDDDTPSDLPIDLH